VDEENIMTRRSILVLLGASVLSFSLVASAKLEGVGTPEVRALANGPGGMKIQCDSKDLKAEEKDGKIVLTAALTNIKTGIGLRDKHLRGYLKTDQHPNATLEVDKSKLKLPDDKKTTRGSATGQFTLHGVTKPVKFTYKAKRTGSDYHVQGLSEIDIRDFKIEVPCYLGVCVKPEVKLKVKFKLRDK
jgi:polyisoprenoid-binding protein YceI